MRLGIAQIFIAEELKINTVKVIKTAAEAADRGGIDLLVFPEMCLTGGYSHKVWGGPPFPG